MTISSPKGKSLRTNMTIDLTHWDRDKILSSIFWMIFSNAFAWIKIAIEISLKFGSMDPINNILALVEKMAWHRPGNKPSSDHRCPYVSLGLNGLMSYSESAFKTQIAEVFSHKVASSWLAIWPGRMSIMHTLIGVPGTTVCRSCEALSLLHKLLPNFWLDHISNETPQGCMVKFCISR